MISYVWLNRAVKLDPDGTLMMSAEGRYDDFDFAPPLPTSETAVALRPPAGGVKAVLRIDAERLLLVGTDGRFWQLVGNPARDGRIQPMVVLAENDDAGP